MIELRWAGARKQTSYWDGTPVTYTGYAALAGRQLDRTAAHVVFDDEFAAVVGVRVVEK